MSVNQEATRPGRTIEKGMLFPDRKACTTYIHDLALASGKRAIIDKSKSSGKNIRFVCNSKTPSRVTAKQVTVMPCAVNTLQAEPSTRAKALAQQIKATYGVDVSTHMVYRSVLQA
ncbi:hypothetical protein ATCC90586_010052 [Pythium insidiosum]|nr:hypothetical protein ATCC90586_010052 [Pythium insidiosum]